jgi:hypothetical protein
MSTASSAIARTAGKGAAMGLFVMTLFTARNTAHMLHLRTDSYAAHKALDEFYNEIIPLVDDVAEAYQGKYDLIPFIEVKCMEATDPVAFLKQINTFVATHRKELPQDSELQNMIDEIAGLIDGTLYKLRFLH